MLGLITGSGFYDVPQISDRSALRHPTPYGEVELTTGRWLDQHEIVFLARHGTDHSVPPHAINYRANVWALHDIGADAILATAVSGGITPGLDPGCLVIIDDFLNFTSGRKATFFDDTVQHTDVTSAYDPGLRALISQAAGELDISITDRGTYVTFDGPRFESPAEIKMAGIVGADLVGMTGYPEVVLASELGVPYASIGVISNLAAGIGDADLSLDEIMAIIASTADRLYPLIGRTIELFGQGT